MSKRATFYSFQKKEAAPEESRLSYEEVFFVNTPFFLIIFHYTWDNTYLGKTAVVSHWHLMEVVPKVR